LLVRNIYRYESMRKTVRTEYHQFCSLLFYIIVLSATACATMPVVGKSEPKVIAVRNQSGIDIITATLRASGRSSGQPTRFASVSPVPAGVTQSARRPTDPPRLPSVVTLEWVDDHQRTHVRDVSLARVLSSSNGSADETLVFEIGPSGDVTVIIEQPDPGSASKP